MAFILNFTNKFEDLDQLTKIFLHLDKNHNGRLALEDI